LLVFLRELKQKVYDNNIYNLLEFKLVNCFKNKIAPDVQEKIFQNLIQTQNAITPESRNTFMDF
jgi:hypothetical protein